MLSRSDFQRPARRPRPAECRKGDTSMARSRPRASKPRRKRSVRRSKPRARVSTNMPAERGSVSSRRGQERGAIMGLDIEKLTSKRSEGRQAVAEAFDDITAKTKIAIACQGGGSQTAFTAGALKALCEAQVADEFEIVSMSGTSGGAVCAVLVWY